MLIRSIALAVALPVFYSKYGVAGAIIAVAVNPYSAIPVQYYWLAKEGVLNPKKEFITLVPSLIIITMIALNINLEAL